MKKGWIPENIYKEITCRMPILFVDLLIWKGGKILLLKRKLPPAQNKWWVPGGRLNFREKLEEAAVRIAEQEVGLKAKQIKQVGIVQRFFRKGYFGKPCHCVSVVFLMVPEEEIKIKLDFQSTAYKWTSVIPKYLTYYFVNVPELPFLLSKRHQL